MIDIHEVTWPDQALEPAVIGDALYEEAVDADDALLAATEQGCLYWEGSARSPLRLCGTDIPGDITFTFPPPDVSHYEQAGFDDFGHALGLVFFGDWATPADQLPDIEPSEEP